MKILHILFIFLIFSSCEQSLSSKEKNNESNYKVDSVVIDSGSDIIFLRDNLAISVVSLDGRYLYNYNAEKPAIEKINLNDEILEEVIQMEREGPNGIGNFHISLNLLNDSMFVISGSDNYSILDNKGDLVKSKKLGYHFYYEAKLVDSFMTMGFLYRDQKAYSIIVKFQSFTNDLMVYTEETDSVQIFDIPKSDLIKSTSIVWAPGNYIYHVPQLSLSHLNNIFLISHSKYPDIVVSDFDSIEFFHYYPDSKLYSRIEEVKEVRFEENEEKVEEFLLVLDKRMNFLAPIWDNQNKVFYRWGFKLSSGSNDLETREYDNFLFIMDSTFQIQNEFKIPEVRLRPYHIFLRENKLYLYHNYNDELMFIRIWLENL